jgi:hypothetical protein
MRRLVILALAAAAGMSVAAVGLAQKAPRGLDASQTSGVVQDESLRALAPKAGFIVEPQEFKKLSDAWGVKGLTVDFATQFVIVETADGPNRVGINATLEDDGNLKVVGMSTLMAGKGFGYGMMAYGRKGVKTVNGKPLPEPTTTSAPATQPSQPTTRKRD